MRRYKLEDGRELRLLVTKEQEQSLMELGVSHLLCDAVIYWAKGGIFDSMLSQESGVALSDGSLLIVQVTAVSESSVSLEILHIIGSSDIIEIGE